MRFQTIDILNNATRLWIFRGEIMRIEKRWQFTAWSKYESLRNVHRMMIRTKTPYPIPIKWVIVFRLRCTFRPFNWIPFDKEHKMRNASQVSRNMQRHYQIMGWWNVKFNNRNAESQSEERPVCCQMMKRGNRDEKNEKKKMNLCVCMLISIHRLLDLTLLFLLFRFARAFFTPFVPI